MIPVHRQPYEQALNTAVRYARNVYRGVGYLGTALVMWVLVNAVRHAAMGSPVEEPVWHAWACLPFAFVLTELLYGFVAVRDERRGGS